MGAIRSASLHQRWFALGLLAAVAVLGVLVCVQPFTGDQALFASGARQLAHGDVLYRDVWDVKQPGIYAFYLAGGELLGYSEVALHLFELGTLLAFAVVLATTLRGRFERAWIVAVVPVLIVGTYYATVEPLQLGQVESLVGIPLYLALWCSACAGEPDARLAGRRGCCGRSCAGVQVGARPDRGCDLARRDRADGAARHRRRGAPPTAAAVDSGATAPPFSSVRSSRSAR